jgi:hypothetical protein
MKDVRVDGMVASVGHPAYERRLSGWIESNVFHLAYERR